jgi:NAD(P)-dependent dehydrogenase (short-subunit alcohol dehydrogenase family)
LWLRFLDLSDTASIRPIVERAFADLGRIDVVVNNAGYGLFGAAEEVSDAQIRHQIDTNLIAPIHVTRAVVPHLRAQGGGRLIAVSTYGGGAAFPGASLYHAGKWGVEGFFDAMAQELLPFGIETTIIEPGGARTGFRFDSAQAGKPLPAYAGTPVAATHAALGDRARLPIGDPAAMVRVMIVDQSPAPRRIALGSDAYTLLHKALSERLALLESQRDLAFSTDLPAGT